MTEQLEIPIRMWRMTRGIPSGSHVWFDESRESVKLYRIPPPDGEVALEDDGGVALEGESGYLDKVGSVSASGPDRARDDSSREVNGPREELLEDLPF